jgi:hypothetical protein
MADNDGGQAFPVPAGNFSGGEAWSPDYGMSLRDYFAAKAPIPDEVLSDAIDTTPHLTDAQPKLARWCFSWADAMLAARATPTADPTKALIAAAPELLAACRFALDTFKGANDDERAVFLAAIAKAEGR